MTRSAPLGGPARVLLGGSFVNALGTGLVLPFLLIYLHTVRGIGLGTTGLLLALPGVVGFVAGPVGGMLADRFGAQRVLTAGTAASGAASCLITLIHAPGLAVPILVLYGVGNALFFPSQSGLFARVADGPALQRMFATNFVLLNGGIGVGGLVAGLLVSVHDPGTFDAIYLANGASFLLYAVVVAAIRVPGPRVHAAAAEGSYRAVLRHPLFVPIFALAVLLAVVGYSEIDSGLPALVTVSLGLPPGAVAAGLVANTVLIVVGQFLVLRQVERIPRTRALVAVAGIWAASWLLLGGSVLVGPHGLRWVIVVAFGALFGLGETFMAPTVAPMTNAVAPEHLRGRFFALTSLAYSLAFTIAPPIATSLIGHHLAGAWIVLLVGGCGVLALLALRVERRLTPEQNGALVLPDPEAELVR